MFFLGSDSFCALKNIHKSTLTKYSTLRKQITKNLNIVKKQCTVVSWLKEELLDDEVEGVLVQLEMVAIHCQEVQPISLHNRRSADQPAQ